MKMQVLMAVLLLGSFGLNGCSDNGNGTTEKAANKAIDAKQVQTEKVANPHAVVAQTAGNQGAVLSVLQAGGYTYVEVENSSGVHWLASSKANIEKGMDIRWGDYAVMKNFNSKALQRTFDEILFVAKVVPANAVIAPVTTSGTVKSVTEAGGYNYIETEVAGDVIWLAAPISSVNKGDKVSWQGATTMNDFYSKTLNKTFKSILFVGRVTVSKS